MQSARAKTPRRLFGDPLDASLAVGGLKVNRHGQVIRTAGAPIPGLYAAGETVGMMYGTYVGATSVLRALVFGRLAGDHAARSGGGIGA